MTFTSLVQCVNRKIDLPSAGWLLHVVHTLTSPRGCCSTAKWVVSHYLTIVVGTISQLFPSYGGWNPKVLPITPTAYLIPFYPHDIPTLFHEINIGYRSPMKQRWHPLGSVKLMARYPFNPTCWPPMEPPSRKNATVLRSDAGDFLLKIPEIRGLGFRQVH